MSTHIVSLLVAERDKLNRAIEALQGPTKRRGRPPKNPAFDYNAPNVPDWVKPKTAAPAKKLKKRTFTAAQRKAFGKRMKAYWAAKKKAAKVS